MAACMVRFQFHQMSRTSSALSPMSSMQWPFTSVGPPLGIVAQSPPDHGSTHDRLLQKSSMKIPSTTPEPMPSSPMMYTLMRYSRSEAFRWSNRYSPHGTPQSPDGVCS